ncbi:MAG: hypothetical protein WC794_01810 [Candidatus Doudnabacteria bacterium]|jgi:hypothetical protein
MKNYRILVAIKGALARIFRRRNQTQRLDWPLEIWVAFMGSIRGGKCRE